MSDRWIEVTESEYAWEKEALDYLRRQLPGHEPYRAWSNFEFIAANGFINEVDALVGGRSRLYLVEIKSRPGRLTGDQGTWTWHTESGRRLFEDNPRKLANLKAKKLKSLLQPHMRKVRLPFIEAVVFLSDPQLRCELDAGGRAGVHLRHGIKGDTGPHILQVLFERDGDGSPYPLGERDERPIDAAQSRSIKHAMEAAGIRRSQRHALVGDYRLETLLQQTELHQDWLAHHAHVKGSPRRVRIYPRAAKVPGATRAVQERAAENEFRLLERLDHPSIPRAEGFPPSERGDCLVFRHDPDAERLDLFLERAGDSIDFGERIHLLRDLAEAVRHAHGRNVHHRTLSPQTVLVSRAAGSGPTVKIVDWQNASEGPATSHASRTVLGQTLHVDLMGDRQGLLYAAPEVRSGHDADGRALDVYSLGAIAYHLFSGRAPATSVEELERRQRDGSGLEIASVLDGATDSLSFLIKTATDPDPFDRPASIAEFLQYLNEVEDEYTAPRGEGVDPREARTGDRLDGGFTVRDRLGSGSTGFALLVDRDDGRSGVLKVAESAEKNERLVREGETLARLRHQHVVELYDSLEIEGLRALFMAQAGVKTKTGVLTLAHRLREEGRLSLDLLQRFGEELLISLVWLEAQGVSHRDIKPDNIGIASAGAKGALTLVLFDFSLAGESPENVRAGTVGYLDPFLRLRQPARWDAAAERYAAAVTLHEMATGQLPLWGDGIGDPATLEGEATLESERFDPSVRERLIHFFRIALARDADERFDNAEEMRAAWYEAFRHIDRTTVTSTTGHGDEPDYETSLDGASHATPLAELGLSPRVLNALERLGAGTLGELLGLKPVRMWRNQGIGQKVVAEIRALREAAQKRLGATTSSTAADAFEAAEIDVADGHWSVKRLADQLLAGKVAPEDRRLLGIALGLEGEGTAFDTAVDTATTAGVPATEVRRVLREVRGRWAERPWMRPLRDDVADIVRRHGGILTARELADALLAARGALLTGEDRRRAADAVARAVVEAESVREGARFALARHAGRVLVVETEADTDDGGASVDARARYAVALGEVCDEIAQAEPLLTPDRVVDALGAIPAPDGSAPLSVERQRRLGTSAANGAALSSRLEIYPRDMSAERALRLGAGSLLGPKALRCEEIVARIGSRYPEAKKLSTKPSELRALLKATGSDLVWDARKGEFVRLAGPLSRFSSSTLHRSGTGTYADDEGRDEADREAAKFDETLRATVEDRRFLVVAVAPKRYGRVAECLSTQFGLETVSLERGLVEGLEREVRSMEADWDFVRAVDGTERSGADWQRLRGLAAQVTKRLTAELLQGDRPRLLLHAGLIARYGQMSLLDELQEAAEAGRTGAGYVLLLPMDEQAAKPMIDGTPVPLTLPSRFVRASRAWIERETEIAVDRRTDDKERVASAR